MRKTLHLSLILSFLLLSRAAIDLNKWELFADDTTELSVRGQRMGRLLASGEDTLGFPLQFFDQTTQSWVNEGLKGVHLRVGKTQDFYSTKSRNLYSRLRAPGGTWFVTHSCYATQFALDYNDDGNRYIYFTGSSELTASPTTYLRTFDREAQQSFQWQANTVVNIAVESGSEKLWIVLLNGDMYRHHAGQFWIQHPGKANSIAFGSTKEPYIVSQDATSEGFAIKKWNADSENWETIPGVGGVFVTLDDQNNLYVVTNDKKVYRQRGASSSFCPMCRENCPICASYEGYCTSARDQCINCPPGTFAADSPLRCEPCPADCPECSSPTICTACPANFYLTPNGTCLASCDAPLVSSTESGKLMCKGPCAAESADIFYYPADESCRPTCEVPFVDSTAIYQSCDPCPDNCLTCSSATNCSQCSSTHFLTPRGTCRSSCPAPLVSLQDNDGNLHCEGPCADQVTDIHYYPSDGSCRSACDVPVSTCSVTTF